MALLSILELLAAGCAILAHSPPSAWADSALSAEYSGTVLRIAMLSAVAWLVWSAHVSGFGSLTVVRSLLSAAKGSGDSLEALTKAPLPPVQ